MFLWYANWMNEMNAMKRMNERMTTKKSLGTRSCVFAIPAIEIPKMMIPKIWKKQALRTLQEMAEAR